jgi:hypothetical protein
MVRQHAEKVPGDLPLFLDWAGMSEDEFYECVRDRRDPSIWEKVRHGEYRLRGAAPHSVLRQRLVLVVRARVQAVSCMWLVLMGVCFAAAREKLDAR